MKNRVTLAAVILLILSIGNYMRITSGAPVRPIQFLSIFLIGLFAGVLFSQVLKNKKMKE